MEQLANRKRRVTNFGAELSNLKELADMMSCILTDSSMVQQPAKPLGIRTSSLPMVSHERNHRKCRK